MFHGATRRSAAHFQRSSALFCRHGGFHCQVGGTGGYLGLHNGQFRQLTQHTHIHHLQPSGNGAGQHADGSATGSKILHHFAGHDGRIGGHTFCCHAVVTGKHGDGRLQGGRNGFALPGSKATGHRFQYTQAASRFGQRILALQGGFMKSVGRKGNGLGHGAVSRGWHGLERDSKTWGAARQAECRHGIGIACCISRLFVPDCRSFAAFCRIIAAGQVSGFA